MDRREFLKVGGIGASVLSTSKSNAIANREKGSGKLVTVFAQITDLHLEGPNPVEAASNLEWAIREIGSVSPQPACVLVTGDLVMQGRPKELARYVKIVKGAGSPVPLYALPASHDLPDAEHTQDWERLIGPLRLRVEAGGLSLVLWDEFDHRDKKGWKAMMSPAKRSWLQHTFRKSRGRPVVVAQHSPPLPINRNYHDVWRDSNADELLDLLRRSDVLCVITGHWHRNGEWTARGLRVINTGPLCGFQYNGVAPYLCFPTRPGYRLFYWDGDKLHSFWREGSYWKYPATTVQVTLTHIGEVHTGGPRPQVRPVIIGASAMLRAAAYVSVGQIASVEWSLSEGSWRPMRRIFDGPWSEWEDVLDPDELRVLGSQTVVVRTSTGGPMAYDAVPIELAERECFVSQASPIPGREMVYELYYPVR
jgi:3',5'-cyclic-AMP phosphodiesterase